MGNLTQDVAWWGRPEDMTAERHPRPAYFAYTAEGASDLAGQLVGALASASLAIGSHGREAGDAAYAAQLLQQARGLYAAAAAHPGGFAARYHYQCTSRFSRARLGVRNVASAGTAATCVPPTHVCCPSGLSSCLWAIKQLPARPATGGPPAHVRHPSCLERCLKSGSVQLLHSCKRETCST